MRGLSHRYLGSYLAQRYMPKAPSRHVRAFLFGCIEPDRNPLTYLKGSLRCQWLRGHNYHNAQRYMRKLSRRLARKHQFNLYDYYSLGKLIHYTADAFTFAHNTGFSAPLREHRTYESELQNQFLAYIDTDPYIKIVHGHTIMNAIISCHRNYEQESPGIHTDIRYTLAASCCVLTLLFAKPAY